MQGSRMLPAPNLLEPCETPWDTFLPGRPRWRSIRLAALSAQRYPVNQTHHWDHDQLEEFP